MEPSEKWENLSPQKKGALALGGEREAMGRLKQNVV